ncbi:MAG: hypothetical protein H0T45_02775 [Pyrinomonadaceae bacterium]|nr:hypothetical protein [Pyrinomonadaceae bacterium]
MLYQLSYAGALRIAPWAFRQNANTSNRHPKRQVVDRIIVETGWLDALGKKFVDAVDGQPLRLLSPRVRPSGTPVHLFPRIPFLTNRRLLVV